MARLKYMFLVLLVAAVVKAQENAQTRVPKSLLECYEDQNLNQRDQRLPMTVNMLIELIRKVEQDPAGANMDMRMLAISLIHRFRLDGIVKAPGVAASSNVVPYSPHAYQFYKHRLLLTNLIPGNAFTFPNNSLTSIEKCSLHHMLSNTIELEARGDEGTVCNRLSQYRRADRLPRDIEKNPDEKSGKLTMSDDDDIKNNVDVNIGTSIYSSDATTGNTNSQCPIEDGVVHSTWGYVSAGTLIAGIAAGLQPLSVNVGDLSQRMSPTAAPERNRQIAVDNKFAVTLGGDLAEASLRQGPTKRPEEVIEIGAPGGWNNTQNPKWYFLTKSENNEFTDAEIRGGLDGLILGTYIKDFQTKSPSLKLSQLLDLYYSNRGVFSETYRACNRKTLMPIVAPTDRLKDQALGFSYVLDIIMQSKGTITPDGFIEYSSRATESLNSYIPRSLNDLSCSVTDDNTDVEISSDIHLVLDSSWQYNFIYNQLGYILNEMNVSPLGSNYTLMDAREARIVLNSSNSMAAFHINYNYTIHQSLPNGFDLPKVLETLKQHFQNKLNREKDTNSPGGKSSVVLMIINSATISDADLAYSIEQLKIMYDVIPDVRFLYLTSGPKDRFNDLVRDPIRDIITMRESENTTPQLNSLISRVKDVQRRLINPRCGSDFKSNDRGVTQLIEYVAPTMVNYYRVHPNYFYGLTDTGTIKIQGHGFGTLNVCHSRIVERPRKSNSTISSEGFECQSVTSNVIELTLRDACKNKDYINKCEPLFVSVEGVGTPSSARCSDRGCRYPDNIKYTISIAELGCYSAGNRFIINFVALSLSVFLILKNFII